MRFRKIIRYFDLGNVCVCGLRGKGKDMLTANVVARRKLPYVSNVDYGYSFNQLHPMDFNCGGNTFRNFIEGNVKKYVYPFPDGVDVYISDAGVYFPSQYCSLIDRDYGYFATFMALSRHLGCSNVHVNVQNLNRCWTKIVEQSDSYIMCNWCKVFFGKIVVQKVTIYELYDAAVKRVPVFCLPKPWFNSDRIFQWKIQKQNYEIAHGSIKPGLLVYINKSNYNTRIFKEVLANGAQN